MQIKQISLWEYVQENIHLTDSKGESLRNDGDPMMAVKKEQIEKAIPLPDFNRLPEKIWDFSWLVK